MKIFLIFLIFVYILCTKILHKKGFTTMTLKSWILISFIILFLFYKYPKNRIILILLISTNKTLYTAVSVTFHLFSLIILKSYFSFRKMASIVFNQKIINKKPTIYISNYPSDFIEYLLPGILPENLSFIAFRGAVKYLNPIFGKERIISVDLDNKGNFECLEKEVEDRIKKNHIFCYVEKNYYERKDIYTLKEFRSGIFHIAKKLNITITPIVCEHFENEYGIIKNNINVTVLESIKVENVEESIKICREKMGKVLSGTRYKI